MALVELLLSTLVIGLVYSAPTEVVTHASGGSSTTAGWRGLKLSSPSEIPSSSPVPKVLLSSNESTSVTPPPDKQEASSPYRLLFTRRPPPDKEVLTTGKADEKKEEVQTESDQGQKLPKTEAPETHTFRQHAIRSQSGGDGRDEDQVTQVPQRPSQEPYVPQRPSHPPYVPQRPSYQPYSPRPVHIPHVPQQPEDSQTDGKKPEERKEEVQSESDDEDQKVPETEAPVAHTIRQHAIRSLPDGDSKDQPQRPEDSQSDGRMPLPYSVYGGAVRIPEEPNVSSREELPSSHMVPPDSRPQVIDLEPAVEEAVVLQPAVSSPQQISAESVQSNDAQSPDEPQRPLQVDDSAQQARGPPYYVQPNVGVPPIGGPSARSSDDVSDSSDESPFPVVIAEEVAEIPALAQDRYPPVLVREDMVPSILPQDASPYDASQIVPLSVESASEESSEEPLEDPSLHIKLPHDNRMHITA